MFYTPFDAATMMRIPKFRLIRRGYYKKILAKIKQNLISPEKISKAET